jgi:transcriptional antiterminator RfaH
MLDCTPRWYVAQTHPHAEAKAAVHLDRQGFRIYLPRYLKRRRHARRIDTVAAPLFPRYLFVAIDPVTQRWRAIQSTVGITQLVCRGDVPAVVGDEIIADLRARETDDGLVRLDQQPKFKPGDKIRLLDGAFTDCLGLYDGMRDSDRIAVLLDLLGRKVRVTVDLQSVAAA